MEIIIILEPFKKFKENNVLHRVIDLLTYNGLILIH